MKSETTLLLELSKIQGQRHSKEIKILRDLMDERNEVNPALEAIVRDNWETDTELEGRFYE